MGPAQIIKELVDTCRSHDFTDIVVVHEHRGEPDGLVICHLPYGPTAYFGVYNTVRSPMPLCTYSDRLASKGCPYQKNVGLAVANNYWCFLSRGIFAGC